MPSGKKHREPRRSSRKSALQKAGACIAIGAIILIAAALAVRRLAHGPNLSESKMLSEYAGSESCRACHKDDYELWFRSHHGHAERAPQADLDRAAFEPARSVAMGNQSIAVRADGTNFFATCIGLSRSNETHAIVRVIGDNPLRQFLVAFPGGRLQALEAAWDPRAQQWFDVFGNENRQPGEWGHWTGRGMNWNSSCAACHNTRFQKNYDAASDSYHTTMAERSVGCESCHGPLQAHVEWQRKYGGSGKKDSTVPKFSREQTIDNCGFCHARRSDLAGDFKLGDSFFDNQSLSIVDASDNFYPDGQVRGEDYEFAAFYGSKMHAHGVSCMDCHNPHSAKTILAGNALCLRCHNGSFPNAPLINAAEHTHHQENQIKPTGGECVSCHMPQTVYMQRHWRHDHGFTIPDPLLTKEFNIPNACNRCHTDKTADWALAACEKWYGKKMERSTRQRTEWIARARNGDATARQPLIAMLTTEENPYWQAVAAGLLGQWPGETNATSALLKCLGATNALVRETAVRALEPLAEIPEPAVTQEIGKLLADPVRSVRVATAWDLRADLQTNTPAARELEHYLDFNSDQPTGQLQQGAYALAKNDLTAALGHYQKAVAWDPNSAPLRHDLAITLSLLNRPREAIEQLEAACRLEPKEAEYEFKLGLAWNELDDLPKTVSALEKTVQLNPLHGRAWFNLGLARNSLGQSEAALDALSRAESLIPNDPEIPYARATILLHLSRTAEARRAASRAIELDPNYSDARKLIDSLQDGPAK